MLQPEACLNCRNIWGVNCKKYKEFLLDFFSELSVEINIKYSHDDRSVFLIVQSIIDKINNGKIADIKACDAAIYNSFVCYNQKKLKEEVK